MNHLKISNVELVSELSDGTMEASGRVNWNKS